MTAFCDEADVRRALQELDLTGATGSAFVSDAIAAATGWFSRESHGHWYDSGSELNDSEVPGSVATASTVRLDVPSSPHRQDRQLVSHRPTARYPVTSHGPYAAIPLPHLYVGTVSKLDVRDLGGNVDDWVAGSQVEGRGEDYYVERDGHDAHGRTYLYVRAGSIGRRQNFDGLLTLTYDYGLDWQTHEWADVRRGVAALAAAEVVDDDSVLAQIPDNGQLVGVDTQHQNLVDRASRYLDPYLEVAVA